MKVQILMKRIYLLILFCILLVIPFSLAWSCATHIAICENNYNYYSPNPNGCCRADFEKKISPVLHHCADNATDCRAREKSLEFYYIYENQTIISYINQTIGNYTYYNQPINNTMQVNINPNVDLDIYHHLIADANCPAHWYSLNGNDHSKFENCVNEQVKMGNHNWVCSMDFYDKSGVLRHLYADNSLIKWKEPPKDIAPVIVNYTQPVNNYIPEVKKGLWEKFMDWFKSLFSSKPIVNNQIENNTNETGG